MKKIPWQAPVKLVQIDGTEIPEGGDNPLTFERFLLGRLADQVFGSEMARILVAVKLRELVINASNHVRELVQSAHGDWAAVADFTLDVEDADWEFLRQAVEKPSGGWNPTVAHNLVSFMRAVTEAKAAA